MRFFHTLVVSCVVFAGSAMAEVNFWAQFTVVNSTKADLVLTKQLAFEPPNTSHGGTELIKAGATGQIWYFKNNANARNDSLSVYLTFKERRPSAVPRDFELEAHINNESDREIHGRDDKKADSISLHHANGFSVLRTSSEVARQHTKEHGFVQMAHATFEVFDD